MALAYPAKLSDLRSRVRSRLLTTSTSTDHWADARIKEALNRAQLEVQSELLETFDTKYFLRTDASVVPSDGIIFMPDGWIRMAGFDRKYEESWIPVTVVTPSRAVEYRYSTPLIPLNASRSTLQPEVWSLIGDKLEMQLGPTTDETYRLRWVGRIDDLDDDDDESEIPAEYHDLLVDNAAMRLSKDGGEVERAAMLMSDYQEGLSRMKRTASPSNPGMVHRIRRTYRGGIRRGGAWWGI